VKILIGVDNKGVIVSGTSLDCPNEVIGDDLKYLAGRKDISIHVAEGPVKIGAYFPYYKVPTEAEIKKLANFNNMR
jgi:hypothetical protein